MDGRVRIDEKQPLALRGARAGIARGGDLPMIYADDTRVVLPRDFRCRIGRRIIHNDDFVLPANCLSRAMDCLQGAAKLRLLVMRRNDERNHVAGLDHPAKTDSQPWQKERSIVEYLRHFHHRRQHQIGGFRSESLVIESLFLLGSMGALPVSLISVTAISRMTGWPSGMGERRLPDRTPTNSTRPAPPAGPGHSYQSGPALLSQARVRTQRRSLRPSQEVHTILPFNYL